MDEHNSRPSGGTPVDPLRLTELADAVAGATDVQLAALLDRCARAAGGLAQEGGPATACACACVLFAQSASNDCVERNVAAFGAIAAFALACGRRAGPEGSEAWIRAFERGVPAVLGLLRRQ